MFTYPISSRAYTMTGPERIVALCRAVEDVERRRVAGAIVECGVWRGGSMMTAALSLLRLRAAPRELYLFDTFSGMTAPDPNDRDHEGKLAADLLLEQSAYGEAVRARRALTTFATIWRQPPTRRNTFISSQATSALRCRTPHPLKSLSFALTPTGTTQRGMSSLTCIRAYLPEASSSSTTMVTGKAPGRPSMNTSRRILRRRRCR